MTTQYGAARSLILIVLIASLIASGLIAIAGLMSISDFGAFSFLMIAGGILLWLVSFAIYEFFKAFLDLVDNSQTIKDQLRETNKLLSEK
ncbi:hypothetical protein [Roseinatronobacter monicus]|uniref:Uncharacterized protein n=1 Tax=Roseinatronobacter monicus TaxID=393481 RepID=A0A543KFB9_9RHOB|nr:hypothetical protein [Roseinatronobacter monicus]TQM93775.1 hypothetical protein BD293_2424 [Roseinatronobacter monicus]